MTRRDIALTMVFMLMLGSLVAASLTTWLLLTSPMTAVSALESADLMPLVRAAVETMYSALLFLTRYL